MNIKVINFTPTIQDYEPKIDAFRLVDLLQTQPGIESADLLESSTEFIMSHEDVCLMLCNNYTDSTKVTSTIQELTPNQQSRCIVIIAEDNEAINNYTLRTAFLNEEVTVLCVVENSVNSAICRVRSFLKTGMKGSEMLMKAKDVLNGF